MRRGTLPVLLFLLAAGGTLFLGTRILASERASAFEASKERLRAKAREAAGVLVAEASRLLREAATGIPDAIRAHDGSFLKPEEPRTMERLSVARDRDPEADFYLAQGERAEALDKDLDRAAGLYGAASSEGRDTTTRLVAFSRLAALEWRRGRESEARKQEAAFLQVMPAGQRTSLEALVIRARAVPQDPDLRHDLLLGIGGPDEVLALGLLRDTGLEDDAALASRRVEVGLMQRIRAWGMGVRSVIPPDGKNQIVIPLGEAAGILGGEVIAFTRSADGTTRFRTGSWTLPPGISLADHATGSLEISLNGMAARQTQVIETVEVGEPLPGERVSAAESADSVLAEASRSAWLLGGELAALLLAGGAAFVLSVRAARRETEAARARADFVTKVGHELRTPLAVVRMYAETLAAGRVADPAEAREFAAVAAREAERLSGMVGQVLDLSRVSEGIPALARRSLDLAALAGEVAAVHRPLLEHAGVTITVRASDPLPVLGDSAALRGAVSNLLENAGRHAASGGSVELEALRDGRMAVVRVLDRGPGIPQGMEERVFERFVRGPGAVGPGAGLGLALVREAAAAHGGAATASNREGGGAVFTLALPAAEEAR
jgi:signal transduction histidine kinase